MHTICVSTERIRKVAKIEETKRRVRTCKKSGEIVTQYGHPWRNRFASPPSNILVTGPRSVTRRERECGDYWEDHRPVRICVAFQAFCGRGDTKLLFSFPRSWNFSGHHLCIYHRAPFPGNLRSNPDIATARCHMRLIVLPIATNDEDCFL